MTQKRRTRKRLIIAAIILVPLLVIFCLWAFVDSPPPDDADLRLTYDPIPDDQNAYTYFYEASLALYRPTPKDGEEERRIRSVLDGILWDEALASMLVEKNVTALDLMGQGLSCPRYQIPEAMVLRERNAHTARLREIGYLAAIKAELLRRQGREQEALDQAITAARLGVRLQDGPGGYMAYVCGRAVIERGMQSIRRLLADSTLSAGTLRDALARLNDCYPNEQGIVETLKVEYAAASKIVDDVHAGRLSFFQSYPWVFRLMDLKPNKTKRLFAYTVRRLITDVRLPYARASALSTTVRRNNELPRIKALASGNGKGLTLHNWFTRNWCYFCLNKCHGNCSVAATRILLALKCYQLEHGELPDTLAALVPDYLDAVPLDDFDGKTIKFSKAKKVVYAVGTDLTDDGGIARDDREGVMPGPGYDLIYKITF